MPAKTLEEVFSYFQNEPISVDELDEFYVNADHGRGKPVAGRLKRRLVLMPSGSLKILLVGHRGCGKSTELVRLQKDIASDFVILSFSVILELDPLNISYIELFIVTMEKLFNFFQKEENIQINEKYLENITNWLTSREVEEINQEYVGLDVEAGMKGGINIPFLAEFFAKFRAAAKSSSSMKEVLKTKVEPKLSELILNCNLLIEEIKKQLARIGKKGLVIIIEDLDKLDIEKGEDIFYVHATQLTQLKCHCIFTFPIALHYNIKSKAIKNNFEEAFVLPMVKVHEKNGVPNEKGIRILRDIIEHRMNLSLFDDKNTILDQIIKASGGCLWDLFRMIREAADNALDFGRIKIGMSDFTSAYKALKADYNITIAENREKGITVEQYYQALKECALDPIKKPMNNEICLDLMNNLTLLGYNEDDWYDVHPIVKDILKERGLIGNEHAG